MEDVSGWVLSHHERPDGTGYPQGLSGTDIPIEARILAVADAYEAMTSNRIYRAAMSEADARAELLRCAGTQFDERVVEAFIRALDAAPSASRLRLVR
jgi:HD-GYP domain-containing protein (c-di-GMP phosphodiesterase class II)